MAAIARANEKIFETDRVRILLPLLSEAAILHNLET
jgi:hypothetical protein